MTGSDQRGKTYPGTRRQIKPALAHPYQSSIHSALPNLAVQLEALQTQVQTQVQQGVGLGGGLLGDGDAACRAFLAQANLPSLALMSVATPCDILYLVTEIYPAGGHRLLLEQMIRACPHLQQRVLFTGLLQRTARFSNSHIARLGLLATSPDPIATLWDKWLWLRAEIAAIAPQQVVLLQHSQDVLAAILAQELAPLYGPRLLVLRHADSVASLGSDLPAATHLAIRPQQEQALRAACPDLRVALLPLCYDPSAPLPRLVAEQPLNFSPAGLRLPFRQRMRARLWQKVRHCIWALRRRKFATQIWLTRELAGNLWGRTYFKTASFNHKKLVTATCGSQHKFHLEGPFALPAVIIAILRASGGRHVHIGPASPAFRSAVHQALHEAGIGPARLHFAGEVPSVASALRWHGAGLYLGSFPVSGALSRAEAAFIGLPIATLDPGPLTDLALTKDTRPNPTVTPYLTALDFAPAQGLIWRSAEDLARQLQGGLSAARRHLWGQSARAWYDSQLSPERFGQSWAQILAALPTALPRLNKRADASSLFATVSATLRGTLPATAQLTQTLPLCPEACTPQPQQIFAAGFTLRIARPRIVAPRHIAPALQRCSVPPIAATLWQRAEVVGGADGFITDMAMWYDPSLDDFDRTHMQLRQPGAVQALQNGQVKICRKPSENRLDAAIFACGCYSHNYFHFLLEVLPRALAAAQIAPAGTPLLTEDDLPAQHYQALRLCLPGHPILRLARGASVEVATLYAANMANRVLDANDSAPAGALRYHPSALRGVADLRQIGAAAAASPEKLLLWRHSKVRRLRNAAALRKMLETRGFKTVDPAKLSFSDQIRLLSRARIVVAQSGAQLANMVFAPPGCRIFALFSDAPGVNYRLWSALAAALGHELINLAGPQCATRFRLPNRILPPRFRRNASALTALHCDFTMPLSYLAAFFGFEGGSFGFGLSGLLDILSDLSDCADVLTGSWAVVASGTPVAFLERLSEVRQRAVLAVLAGSGSAIAPLLEHRFFADYGLSLRSGFTAFSGLAGWEQALGAAVVARLADLASEGDIGGAGAAGFATAVQAALNGAEDLEGAAAARAMVGDLAQETDRDVALRRVLALAMLLVPNWRMTLPSWLWTTQAATAGAAQSEVALAEDVLGLWLHWATVPPFLHRAGEDAAWVAHVARLLNWVADGLDALSPQGLSQQGLTRAQHQLRQRLLGLVSGLDLGQLLLVDVGLCAVQAARNRVLAHVALREKPTVAGAAGQVGRQAQVGLRPNLGLDGRGLAAKAVADQSRLAAPPVSQGRRRIGILCRTFEKGPDSEAVVAFLQGFDRSRYEIFAYSVGFRDRVVSRDPGFDAHFDSVIAKRRTLPVDPAGMRAMILADQLDVFLYANATTYGIQPLDVALYHRVAPVQLVLNSHVPMAMGYPSFDAMLTGQSDDQAQELDQADYAERLIRAPGPVISYLTSLQPRQNPPLDRAALGLGADAVVMMNAGSALKLRAEALRTMMQAVLAVPKAVLLLAPYNPGWAARSLAFGFNVQLAETAAEVGLDPARIIVLGELSVAEAEAALSCADIYLNPFPHGGATMTHLALIYGVPPVTLRRRSTRSIDQFLVQSLGFDSLLVSSPAEYVARAQQLGCDSAARKALSQAMAQAARQPVFVNNLAYSRQMQAALEAFLAERGG
jgi:predicted O-linked N-acetylglucosamine transferase (SPINDLY family)/capsular polysaccharide biosynthesis protein